MHNYYIQHSGIKGMRWGIRRFQNLDGTLTEAGKLRYGANSVSEMGKEGLKKYKSDTNAHKQVYSEAGNISRNAADISRRMTNKKQKVSDDIKKMSDAELRNRINRIQMERQMASLNSDNTRNGAEIATRVLETTGSIIGIASGTLGIMLAINQLKG